MSYRSTAVSSTGLSPYFILSGREFNLPVDLEMPQNNKRKAVREYVAALLPRLELARKVAQENTRLRQEDNKRRYDKNTKTPEFFMGQKVWVHSPRIFPGKKASKFHVAYTGPYYIVAPTSESNYHVRCAKTNQLYPRILHSDRLKPYIEGADPPAVTDDSSAEIEETGTTVPPASAETDQREWHLAEKVTKLKKVNNQVYFLVHWQDKSFKPEWIKSADVSDFLKQQFSSDTLKLAELENISLEPRLTNQEYLFFFLKCTVL